MRELREQLETKISKIMLFRIRSKKNQSIIKGVLPSAYKIRNFKINSEWEQAGESTPTR
jgi:hypothetical protein